MTYTNDDRTFMEDLLARSVQDRVHAAEVIGSLRYFMDVDAEASRDLSIGVIARLLVQGLMVPGDVDRSGFVAWDCSIGEAIVRIAADWTSRDDPWVFPGEVVWLNATPAGLAIGEGVLARDRG